MRYEIEIPSPVVLIQIDGTRATEHVERNGTLVSTGKEIPPWDFRRFVAELTCEAHFAHENPDLARFTPEVLLAGIRCIEMAEGAPGSRGTLEHAVYERLRRAALNRNYHPQAGKSVMPLIQAILNARQVDDPPVAAPTREPRA